jgi:hypothetical protein
MMRNTAPTPKVFNATYKPPKVSQPNGSNRPIRPLLFVGVVLVGGLLISRLPFFQIKHVDVRNSPSIAITELAQSLIGQSIFSNKIQTLARKALEEYPILESFSCTRGLPATVRCEAKAREARFVWKTNDKSYLLDKSGYIFIESTNETLPILEDRAGKAVSIGEEVTSEETVAAYDQLVALLSKDGITVSQLFITESFYQFGAVISARADKTFPGSPITVLFTTSYPVESQVTVLSKVLDERSAQIKERIDLRVPGNVYFY